LINEAHIQKQKLPFGTLGLFVSVVDLQLGKKTLGGQ